MSDLEILYGEEPITGFARGEDTPEQIQGCLSCRRRYCNNCLKRSKERRLSGQYKVPVYQYDKSMRLIRAWPTASVAAEMLGINRGSISSVLHGRMNTAGGFIWRWPILGEESLTGGITNG